MRPARALTLAALFALLSGISACNGTEEQCKTVCDWESRCVQGAIGVDDCTQDCVRDDDARSSDCSAAFDDFSHCVNKNESCPGIDQECQREAARYINKCDCTNPVGPLAALCQPLQ